MKLSIENKLSAYMAIKLVKTVFLHVDIVIVELIVGKTIFRIPNSRLIKELYNENRN